MQMLLSLCIAPIVRYATGVVDLILGAPVAEHDDCSFGDVA